MKPGDPVPRRARARILGRGADVTLESERGGDRIRVHVRSRDGRVLEVEPLTGTGTLPFPESGARVRVRAARPFGLFSYDARFESRLPEGSARLLLDDTLPRRRQLRDYFRVPVQLAVRLIAVGNEMVEEAVLLRAVDLSGGGVLVLDPEERLSADDQVRVGLPIGPTGGMVRLWARVVRLPEGRPRRVGLRFQSVPLLARQAILRYLMREHRRRMRATRRGSKGRILPFGERP